MTAPKNDIDVRVTKSRQTLAGWARMLDSGDRLSDPSGTMKLMEAEIDALGTLAMGEPDKAVKITRLIADWRVLRDRVRAGMH